MNYSKRDLEARFGVLLSFGVPWTHLEHGSPTYGRPWTVYLREAATGGHCDVRYIGMSRREAMRWIDGAVAALSEVGRDA